MPEKKKAIPEVGLRNIDELLTPEERKQLAKDLFEMVNQRRRAENIARWLTLD